MLTCSIHRVGFNTSNITNNSTAAPLVTTGKLYKMTEVIRSIYRCNLFLYYYRVSFCIDFCSLKWNDYF